VIQAIEEAGVATWEWGELWQRAVASCGLGLWRRGPNVISYGGGHRDSSRRRGWGHDVGLGRAVAAFRGELRPRAAALLSRMWEAKLEPDVIRWSASTSACEKRELRHCALALLSGMWGGEAGARCPS